MSEHIIYNKGTPEQFESWTDIHGNNFDKSKDGEVICYPNEKNLYPMAVEIRCNCPFCNEEVDALVNSGFCILGEKAQCPACEKEFEVWHEVH